MARLSGRISDELDKEMRFKAVELGLRYPSEFIEFLWEEYLKNKEKQTIK